MKTVVFRATAAALLLGLATAAGAQVAPPQIAQRQDLMKANSAAIRGLVRMVRGTQPWDADAARKAGATLHDNAQRLVGLFPAGSGTESGAKTAAKPEIWSNPGDFQAKAQALADETAKLAAAGDDAALKSQITKVGKACSGCHEAYRNTPDD